MTLAIQNNNNTFQSNSSTTAVAHKEDFNFLYKVSKLVSEILALSYKLNDLGRIQTDALKEDYKTLTNRMVTSLKGRGNAGLGVTIGAVAVQIACIAIFANPADRSSAEIASQLVSKLGETFVLIPYDANQQFIEADRQISFQEMQSISGQMQSTGAWKDQFLSILNEAKQQLQKASSGN